MIKFNKWLVCFILLLGNYIIGYAMTPYEAKAFYKEAFTHTILNEYATKEDYAKYFSKNFVMKLDGKKYHFDEYVQFMLDLKKDRASIDINFNEMVAESDQVATSHVTHVVNKNGDEIYIDVLSLFKIQNNKFIAGEELIKLRS